MNMNCICEISTSGDFEEKFIFPDEGAPSDLCLEIDENDDLFVWEPGTNSVTLLRYVEEFGEIFSEWPLIEGLTWQVIGMCYLQSKRWLLIASTGPGTGLFSVYRLIIPDTGLPTGR